MADSVLAASESEEQSAQISRRTVLTALAAGSVAVACDATGVSDDMTLESPADTMVPVNGQLVPATETGPPLVEVEMPKPESETPADPAPPAEGDTPSPDDGGTPSPAPVEDAAAGPSSTSTVAALTTTLVGPPTTAAPTTAAPTTTALTSTSAGVSTTAAPSTTLAPSTTVAPSTTAGVPTTAVPTTAVPTTAVPTTAAPTTAAPTTAAPTTAAPTTAAPTTTEAPANAQPAITPQAPVGKESHVGTRLTHGLTPTLLAEIQAMGTTAWIEDQLSKTSPDRNAERYLSKMEGIGKRPDQVRDDVGGIRPIEKELVGINVLRARYSSHQLYEMMCHMWMDHLNIYTHTSNRKHLHHVYQEGVIRPHAMGKYRDLLAASANSGAMMWYLDNAHSDGSSEDGINENYGRELLELHSLGIDENDNHVYTEVDVRNAAKVMSGWGASKVTRGDRDAYTLNFSEDRHWKGTVSLLNGAWTSAGLSGKARGDSLLVFLANHPSTARYVATRICRRFVSDNPSAALLDSTAQVYLDNDTELVPVLRHVFSSDEFYASEGQKLRRPFEQLLAALRAGDASLDIDPESDGNMEMVQFLRDTDHKPWYRQTPDGYPEDAGYWLTADRQITFWNFVAKLGRGALDGTDINRNSVKPSAGTVSECLTKLGVQMGLGTLSSETISAVAAAARVSPGESAAALGNAEFADAFALLACHPTFATR